MSYYELDPHEQAELTLIESSVLTRIHDYDSISIELKKAAKNILNKTRNINIRLSERDLYKLKAKAIEEGIPYQTLASSILHKATSN